jgi:hypothetical protein
MIDFPEQLLKKLETVANSLDRTKPLKFLGIVHSAAGLDGWDLLVASKDPKDLPPWSLEALRDIVKALQGKLTEAEMATILQIVPLPSNNKLISWLHTKAVLPPRSVQFRDEIDQACVVRPKTSPRYWKKLLREVPTISN